MARVSKERTASSEKSADGPRSLSRVLSLFDILAGRNAGLSLAELSALIESPKSSLLNLIRPLVTDGFLIHEHGVYKLGPSIYRLSSKVVSVWNFNDTLHQYLIELSKLTNESVFVGKLDKELGLITYVDAIDSLHSIRYSIAIGTSRPLYCTAAGRVLLANEDQFWIDDYLATEKLERRTQNTTVSRRELKKVLKTVREEELSVCLGELYDESGGLAVPIYGAGGSVVAVLGIGAPLERLKAKLPELTITLKQIAAKASGKA